MKVLTSVLLISLAALLIVPGCGKDDTPTPQTPSGEGSAAKAPDSASAFSMDIDLEKTVDALKAEAAKMSVDKLEAMAKKYKDELVKKEGDLKALTEKLSAIPMMEKMGSEAQAITKDMKTLGETVAALNERFQVYFDAVKAQGGNLDGLM
ncbi:MAG: hypothetical protein ACYTET_06360 [Planctomycetota bacterium]|jgi:Skp family chaperone for outer membrane proteins